MDGDDKIYWSYSNQVGGGLLGKLIKKLNKDYALGVAVVEMSLRRDNPRKFLGWILKLPNVAILAVLDGQYIKQTDIGWQIGGSVYDANGVNVGG